MFCCCTYDEEIRRILLLIVNNGLSRGLKLGVVIFIKKKFRVLQIVHTMKRHDRNDQQKKTTTQNSMHKATITICGEK